MKFSDRLTDALDLARKKTLGAAIGALATMKARRDEETFSIALIALSAKIAKADGAATDAEFAAFRRFFDFPDSEATKVRMIYDLAKQDVAGFSHYAGQVARLFDSDSAVLEDVIDCLLYIALADGAAHPQELSLIEAAAETFGVTPACWRRLKAAHFGVDRDDPYAVLGLEPGAAPATVQARYRELMRQNHPDVLVARGVPAPLVKIADGRAAAINAAYEAILAENRR
ncbi:MAG TPA: molecular chaperone DjlA [Parvularcula sp.]|nr:molecular chaperone DjlA [Parvularcula sp.]HBS31985.1 molecular chaperone DjlA [Parvularcula sp.]HBS36225.1 molecular chaperone DjlA [Parvularcula sp.]